MNGRTSIGPLFAYCDSALSVFIKDEVLEVQPVSGVVRQGLESRRTSES